MIATASSNSLAQPKSGSRPKNEFYLPELDGLRTCAFLSVFLFHASGIRNAPHNFFFELYNRLNPWGIFGVDFFFVLSGYLITLLLLQEKRARGTFSFRLYFMRRMLRIWPLYYLMLFTGAFLLPIFFHKHHFQWPIYQQFLLKIILPMSLWMGNYATQFYVSVLHQFHEGMRYPVANWFMHLWSISAEEQFYITWPLVLMMARTRRQLVLSASALFLCSIICSSFARGSKDPIVSTLFGSLSSLCLLQPLMAGALVAVTTLYFPELWSNIRKFATPLSAAALLLVATLVFGHNSALDRCDSVIYTPLVFAFALILASTVGGAPLKKLMSAKWISAPGKITYGMYIVHFPIMRLVEEFGARHLPWTSGPLFYCVTTGVSLLLTVAIAVILWLSIESKILALRKRFVAVK